MLIKEVVKGFRDVIADSTSRTASSTSYSDRLLYHYLKMCRAQLLYEKFIQEKRPINKFATQSLSCVSLLEVDVEECPCRPMDGCIYLRSSLPLPQTILITDVRAGNIRTDFSEHVKGVQTSEEFNYIKWEDVDSVCHSRHFFDKREKFYSLKTRDEGTYIYLHNREFLKYVDIEGMFEEPLDVARFPSCGIERPCVDALEERFPFDSNLLSTLYKMTFDKYIGIKRVARPDITNNDVDEGSGVPAKAK